MPHTPGPYRVEAAGLIDPDKWFIMRGSRRYALATVHALGRVTTEEAVSNAYLFAAAPDLLEACKMIVAQGDSPEARDAAQKAVAKAMAEEE